MGPCAKRQVTCVIVTSNGQYFIGKNDCLEPVSKCPRNVGEGYEKCHTVCKQTGHAEINALKGWLASGVILPSGAIIIGHDYCCKDCSKELVKHGITKIEFVP